MLYNLNANGGRQVGLAGTGSANEDDILGILQELTVMQ